MALTRRGFLRNLGVLASALSVGLSITMPQRKLKAVWTAEAEQDLQAMHMVGYKGSQFFETGIVYAPYIPLYRTPYVIDPVHVPSKFLRRFASLPLTKGRNLIQLD
jgi:hypothetical protein